MTEQPWVAGAATGVGSLPGEDPAEAVRIVLGELPDLPHLPELPARGLGADLVGRGAALLVDLPVDVQPSGWRLVDRPGRDLRRATDLLARDLDALEEQAQDYQGPLKLQVTGPWTLAATLELHYGDKAVSDPGAVRDLTQSLAEGTRRHVADVARRVPGARVVLQVDEPSVPVVLSGRVPTASGFGTLAAVEEPVVQAGLAEVLAAAAGAGAAATAVHCCAARRGAGGVPGARVVLQVDEPSVPVVLSGRVPTASGFGTLAAVEEPVVQAGLAEVLAAAAGAGAAATAVHCCAARPPLGLFRAAGAGALSVDATRLDGLDEELGGAVEAGLSLWLGVLPGVDAELGDLGDTVRSVRRLWSRLGFPPDDLPSSVVPTPACGLAGASPAYARAALRRIRDTGRALAEDPAG